MPRRVGRGSRAQLVKLGLEVLLALQANDLIHDLAVLEEQQRGDGVDAVLDGEILMVVDVDLGDLDLAIVLGGEFVQHRRELFAGPAPFGPEIDEDGPVRFDDFLIEAVGGQGDNVLRCHRSSRLMVLLACRKAGPAVYFRLNKRTRLTTAPNPTTAAAMPRPTSRPLTLR